MLTFLRKYQRAIFGVVAAATIFSFCFYGTYSAVYGPHREAMIEKKVFATDCNGQPLYEDHIARLISFLSGYEAPGEEERVNPFDQGFFQEEILKKGVAEEIARQYWDRISPDLQSIKASIESKKLYAHPKLPFLHTVAIWEHYAPSLASAYHKVLAWKEREISFEYFQDLVALYMEERAFTPQMLRYVFHEQVKHFGQKAYDPSLFKARLSLMGSCDPTLFFGTQFMHLVAQYVHHVALIAQNQGFSVPCKQMDQLAKARLASFVSAQFGDQEKIQPALFDRAIHLVRMTKGELCDLLGELELFKQMIRSLTQPLLLSPLALEDVHRYGTSTITGHIHRMKDAAVFHSMWELGRFQYYIDSVTKPVAHPLDLPSELQDVESVALLHPSFVAHKASFESKTVTALQAASLIPTSMITEWLVSDEGWEIVCDMLKNYRFQRSAPVESRILALAASTPKDRTMLDKKALEVLVQKNPTLIYPLFEEIQSETKDVMIFLDGTIQGISHLKDGKKLLNALDQSSGDLSLYTEDGLFFHQITLTALSAPQIASFDEIPAALLDDALTNKLLPLYEKVKDKLGGKDFENARDHLVAIQWQSLMRAIETEADLEAPFLSLHQDKVDFSFYLEHRFAKALKERVVGGTLSPTTGPLAIFDPILQPFEYQGRDQAQASLEPLFEREAGYITSVLFNSSWGPYIAELLSVEPSDEVQGSLWKIRDRLGFFAIRAFHEKTLSEAIEQDLFVRGHEQTC